MRLRTLSVLVFLLVAKIASAAEPITLVILGASGDLTSRLLMPSLVQLSARGQLPAGTRIVGVTPSGATKGDEGFRADLKARVQKLAGKLDEKGWDGLAGQLSHQTAELSDPGSLVALRERLFALDAADYKAGVIRGPRRVVFYFALPPKLVPQTLQHLHGAGLVGPQVDNDVVIEKPIGVDAATAKTLNDELDRLATERHTYRMDHYLGKSNIRALGKLRLDDRFSRVWNKKYIDRVDIVAEEAIGVEGRGNFYEQTGAARDMVQSHLLQVASLAAMDTPRSSADEDVRKAKIDFLESIATPREHEIGRDVVRGQYRAHGAVGDYTDEPGVEKGSQTETYVAMRLHGQRGAMKNVPIHIVSGKALRAKNTEVLVHFKRLPIELAAETGHDPQKAATLRIGIAPTTKIVLGGYDLGAIDGKDPLEPYARQMLDVLDRNHAMFPHRRETEASWKVIDAIESAWHKPGSKPKIYAAGSRGPKAARRLTGPMRVTR